MITIQSGQGRGGWGSPPLENQEGLEIFQACNQDFAAQFTATWSCNKGQNQIY
jgi:hypothetical protein